MYTHTRVFHPLGKMPTPPTTPAFHLSISFSFYLFSSYSISFYHPPLFHVTIFSIRCCI